MSKITVNAPRRRRFRFGLRTMFVVLTALAVLSAVVKLKLRQDADRQIAQTALIDMGLQLTISSLPDNRTSLALSCYSDVFGDQQIDPLLLQIEALRRPSDLGLTRGMELLQLDLVKSSISSDGEHRLRQALPDVHIRR